MLRESPLPPKRNMTPPLSWNKDNAVRIGIFGGTFDPVHWGHLLLAEFCREECKLDQVVFVPSAQPPHKLGQPITAGKHRLQMLELATAGNEAFVLSDCELKRAGPSYTYQTLEQFRQNHPGAELFLLLGGDSVAELPGWKYPERICQLARLVGVQRPGFPELDWERLRPLMDQQRWQQAPPLTVTMPLVGLSSREIRRRCGQGLSIRYQVPRAVEAYIYEHGLYSEGGPPEC